MLEITENCFSRLSGFLVLQHQFSRVRFSSELCFNFMSFYFPTKDIIYFYSNALLIYAILAFTLENDFFFGANHDEFF